MSALCHRRSSLLTGRCELRAGFRAADGVAAAAPEPPEHRASEREARREFQRLGSVGPATAADLVQLGFRSTAELRGADPLALYRRLCEITGTRQDPCVEDALRCAIAQAEDPELPARWRKWHRWTPLRGRPAGTLPRG